MVRLIVPRKLSILIYSLCLSKSKRSQEPFISYFYFLMTGPPRATSLAHHKKVVNGYFELCWVCGQEPILADHSFHIPIKSSYFAGSWWYRELARRSLRSCSKIAIYVWMRFALYREYSQPCFLFLKLFLENKHLLHINEYVSISNTSSVE